MRSSFGIDDSMPTTTIDTELNSQLWDWCTEAYLRNGIKLSFPKNTDYKKTYQWRYITSLASKIREWNLDEAATRQFVDIAINYAKTAGVLHKGLSVFHQSNMLQVCYDKLTEMNETSQTAVQMLGETHKWLLSRSDGNLFDTLLYRARPTAFCNLTMWHQASKISKLYIAVSRTCARVLSNITGDAERGQLPSQVDLYNIRTSFATNIDNIRQTRRILGEDSKLKLAHF